MNISESIMAQLPGVLPLFAKAGMGKSAKAQLDSASLPLTSVARDQNDLVRTFSQGAPDFLWSLLFKELKVLCLSPSAWKSLAPVWIAYRPLRGTVKGLSFLLDTYLGEGAYEVFERKFPGEGFLLSNMRLGGGERLLEDETRSRSLTILVRRPSKYRRSVHFEILKEVLKHELPVLSLYWKWLPSHVRLATQASNEMKLGDRL